RLAEIPADDSRTAIDLPTLVDAPKASLGVTSNRAIRAAVAAVDRRSDALGVIPTSRHIHRGALGRWPVHRVTAPGARTIVRVARAVLSHRLFDDILPVRDDVGSGRRFAPRSLEINDRSARPLDACDEQSRIAR